MLFCIEKFDFMFVNCNLIEFIIIIKYLFEGCEMIFKFLIEIFFVWIRFDKKYN